MLDTRDLYLLCYLLTDWPRDILFCQLRIFDTISRNTGDCYKMGSVLEICRANMVFFIHVFSVLYASNCVCTHFRCGRGVQTKSLDILLFFLSYLFLKSYFLSYLFLKS